MKMQFKHPFTPEIQLLDFIDLKKAKTCTIKYNIQHNLILEIIVGRDIRGKTKNIQVNLTA